MDVAINSQTSPAPTAESHRPWIRACHWTVAASFFVLAFTGFLILMVHPRLYWGEVGNDLTPALLELPISNNHRPEGWVLAETFTVRETQPITANRTYDIFNQNGWARSLHFLAAWFLVGALVVYLLLGLITGHVRRHLLPRSADLAPRRLLDDFRVHLRARPGSIGTGPPYGVIQRAAYAGVALLGLPLMMLTGLTMAPAITAAYPVLLDLFGGYQSARTVHFFGFAALIVFLLVHLTMVSRTGFLRQVRAMTTGNNDGR